MLGRWGCGDCGVDSGVDSGVGVATSPGDVARREQQAGQRQVGGGPTGVVERRRLALVEHPLPPDHTLPGVSPQGPVEPCVGAELCRRAEVAGVEQRRQRGGEVGVVRVEGVEPSRELRPAEPGACLGAEPDEVLRVSLERTGPFALVQRRGRIAPHRLQQPQARRADTVRCKHQRLLHQPFHRDDDVAFGGAGHLLRRRQIEPSGEHRQRAEHGLFVGGQQVTAPVERRLHGPLTFR